MARKLVREAVIPQRKTKAFLLAAGVLLLVSVWLGSVGASLTMAFVYFGWENMIGAAMMLLPTGYLVLFHPGDGSLMERFVFRPLSALDEG